MATRRTGQPQSSDPYEKAAGWARLQGNALKEETDPALQALSDREPEQP